MCAPLFSGIPSSLLLELSPLASLARTAILSMSQASLTLVSQVGWPSRLPPVAPASAVPETPRSARVHYAASAAPPSARLSARAAVQSSPVPQILSSPLLTNTNNQAPDHHNGNR